MFNNLTTPEQQRVAQAYMPQMGGKSPSDIGTMMQMLVNNPDMAAQAMTMYEGMSGNNSVSGGNGGPGSRINDILSGMMSNDGTTTPTATTNAVPRSRPSNLQVSSNNPNNVAPPTKPVELTGEDRVAKAGGPGSTGRTNTSTEPTTAVTENSVDPSMSAIIMSVLGGMGATGAGYLAGRPTGPKQMPPTPDGGADVPTLQQPKQLPAEVGGLVVPVRSQFDQAFADDIPYTDYKEVQPKQVAGPQKQLPAPAEEDNSDKRPKAKADETIEAKDETKATTAKEKLKKPKVRVK